MSSTIVGLLIPFLGTVLGASLVFFMRKKELNKKVQKLLLGFAAGVMMAASIWSLLMPALEMTEGRFAWVPVAIGFLIGIIFLLVLDTLIPHQHLEAEKSEGLESNLKKSTKLVLAVTIHNIPEGMAIQNFPEGAIISMPLKAEGISKGKAFLYGAFSGIVEPISAIFAIAFTHAVIPILPYILSFAAGAMIYVVVEELVPESQAGDHSNIGTIGVALGFIIMMILDVALA